LLCGGILVALRLFYSFPGGWVSKIFSNTLLDNLFIIRKGKPLMDDIQILANIHLISIAYQALGIAVITGVVFYILRRS